MTSIRIPVSGGVRILTRAGRRNGMLHYSGGQIGAIRFEDFKIHIFEGHGGLPGMEFCNAGRDPGEKYGQLYPGLLAVTPVQNALPNHMMMIRKFPHRQSGFRHDGVGSPAAPRPSTPASRPGNGLLARSSCDQGSERDGRGFRRSP